MTGRGIELEQVVAPASQLAAPLCAVDRIERLEPAWVTTHAGRPILDDLADVRQHRNVLIFWTGSS